MSGRPKKTCQSQIKGPRAVERRAYILSELPDYGPADRGVQALAGVYIVKERFHPISRACVIIVLKESVGNRKLYGGQSPKTGFRLKLI